MNTDNPTPLRLGMTGSFVGQRYRVEGRVVLSMQDGGQTWTWNEFHLVTTAGTSATLVCEDGDEGQEWRLFTLIEPENPLSVPEAERVRVGDTVRCTGQPAQVTLVDESRVEFIEGRPPEGVEVGDVARYFNAETETEMFVASWTGDEIEFYRGMTIPTGAVAAGFRIPALAPPPRGTSANPSSAGVAPIARWLRPLFILVVLGLGSSAVFRACSVRRFEAQTPTVARINAPGAPLGVGATGTLDGHLYRVAGHAVVEIAQVHQIVERHEYHLLDDAKTPRLLICNAGAAATLWHLCEPLEPAPAFGPVQAGALRVGDPVTAGGTTATVTELFRCTVRDADLRPPELPMGTITYGFTARAGDQLFVARWDASALRLHRGRPLPAAAVTAAFSGKRAP